MVKVRIVSYEDINAWILGKFARKLNEELIKLGVDSDIANHPDPTADINHHIIYLGYEDYRHANENDSLMITHVDDYRKLNLLKKQLEKAGVGVCMSMSLMNEMVHAGLPSAKLCFINPAHDGVMHVKPYVIGITSQVKPDGCKREHLVSDISEHISPMFFEFRIMGSGWESIIKDLRKKGFQITYYPDFDYDVYTKLIPSLDFYFYMGQDEGSMGFIDALAAGVKTIVTPQGFHLDASQGITYPFNTLDELIDVFRTLTEEKKALVDSVAHWTWRDYAIKHLEIWNYLKNPESERPGSPYRDGLNSLLKRSVAIAEKTNKHRNYKMKLYKGALKRIFFKIKNSLTNFDLLRKNSKIFVKKLLK